MCFFSSFLFLSSLMCIWGFPKMVGTPHFTPQVMIILNPENLWASWGTHHFSGNKPYMDVSKNRGTYPKMDGENHGKTLLSNGWFGGNSPPFLGNNHMAVSHWSIDKTWWNLFNKRQCGKQSFGRDNSYFRETTIYRRRKSMIASTPHLLKACNVGNVRPWLPFWKATPTCHRCGVFRTGAVVGPSWWWLVGFMWDFFWSFTKTGAFGVILLCMSDFEFMCWCW